MNYSLLRQKTNLGWNTWNTRNVLSWSHLPEGFTINLCIKDFRSIHTLRESLVGRHAEEEEVIFPGPRSYDGSCAQLKLHYFDTEIILRAVSHDDEQYILVTPLKTGKKLPLLSSRPACSGVRTEASANRETASLASAAGVISRSLPTALPFICSTPLLSVPTSP